MKIQCRNETLRLLPEKALIWERESLLVFSDVHLGKAEVFQSKGVPIPSDVNIEDLQRMAGLIDQFNIKKVLVLGDFIHSQNSWTENLFLTLEDFLRYHHHVQFQLLLGNHEKGSLEYLKMLPIEIIPDDIEMAPFVFSHGHDEKGGFYKEQDESRFTIQGHVHPVVVLQEGPVRLRLPCFVLNSNSLTLPSFGSFTGGFEVDIKKNQKIFAITKKVIEIGI